MEFLLVKDYLMAGLLGKEVFYNENEKEQHFQKFMIEKFEEINIENKQIDILVQEFEREKEEHLKDNEYISDLDQKSKQIANVINENSKKVNDLSNQRKNLEENLKNLQDISLQHIKQKNEDFIQKTHDNDELDQILALAKQDLAKLNEKDINSELEMEKASNKKIEALFSIF